MNFYKIHTSKHAKKHTSSDTSAEGISRENKTVRQYQKESKKTIARRMASNFLILYSLYMIAWVFYKPVLEEVKYAFNNLSGTTYVVAETQDEAEAIQPTFESQEGSTQKGLLNDFLSDRRVQPLVPKDPNFSVVIPKLGANAQVLPRVDAANEEEYLTALQQGVAHAKGTALPGEKQHVYLFAHSTNTFSNVSRYNAIFYLLYKLEEGDEINIFYEGVRHRYQVTGKTVVDPSEVQYLTRKTEGEFLTLQTCWPPGTVAQRMLVFAEPITQ